VHGLLSRINAYLLRWIRRKYERLRSFTKAKVCWRRVTVRCPRLFAHWRWTGPAAPGDQGDKSRMNREVHVRIRGSRECNSPG